ncbi:hypothetical protein IWX81_002442 [Salinibacterium sp. CAN_S4]
MEAFGLFVFGLSLAGVGIFVLLLRKAMGRYAASFWNRRRASTLHQSEKYWTDSSSAQGIVFLALGFLLIATSLMFGQ